jgi:hypothetical protein
MDFAKLGERFNEQKEESIYLQSDYANMNRLQNELQRALKEFESVHSQRIARYIN